MSGTGLNPTLGKEWLGFKGTLEWFKREFDKINNNENVTKIIIFSDDEKEELSTNISVREIEELCAWYEHDKGRSIELEIDENIAKINI